VCSTASHEFMQTAQLTTPLLLTTIHKFDAGPLPVTNDSEGSGTAPSELGSGKLQRLAKLSSGKKATRRET
jgi:hypothetical protein